MKQSVSVGAQLLWGGRYGCNNGRYGCTIVISYIEINKAVSQWLLTFNLCVSVTWPLTCAFHIPCTHTPEIIDMHRGMCDNYYCQVAQFVGDPSNFFLRGHIIYFWWKKWVKVLYGSQYISIGLHLCVLMVANFSFIAVFRITKCALVIQSVLWPEGQNQQAYVILWFFFTALDTTIAIKILQLSTCYYTW